jgi:hypothetical protein
MKYLLLLIFLSSCYSIKNYTPIKIINKDGYYYHAKIINTEKIRYISMIYDTDTINVGDTLLFVKVYNIPGLIDFKLIEIK